MAALKDALVVSTYGYAPNAESSVKRPLDEREKNTPMTQKYRNSTIIVVRFIGALIGLMTATTPTLAHSVTSLDQEVLDELRQIRQLLERLVNQNPVVSPRPKDLATGDKVTLPDGSGQAIGRVDAPVTIVEFSDLQCQFCSEFHMNTFDQLQKDYILTGKVRYISRDLPLPVHPLAGTAARAARCAGEQGQFWEMRHAILAHNSNLTEQSFDGFARELGVDIVAFQSCLIDVKRFENDLKKDRDDASTVGIAGTPSFVIGPTRSGALEGVRIVGAVPFATFEATLKTFLTNASTQQAVTVHKPRIPQ